MSCISLFSLEYMIKLNTTCGCIDYFIISFEIKSIKSVMILTVKAPKLNSTYLGSMKCI